MTVLDLITRAMRLIGAVSIGDPIEAAETAAALLALNDLIDSWGTDPQTKFTSSGAVYTCTAGLGTYTIGTGNGAAWTGPRPESIDSATVIIPGTPTSYEKPLRVIRSDKDWARVRMKALTSTLIRALYYQPDFPNGTVAVWPVPVTSQQVALYTKTAVPQFTGLTQVVSLPPGYTKALTYNLALCIAPEFEKVPSDVVIGIAESSLYALKVPNAAKQVGRLALDLGAQGHRGGHFDYLIGEER